MPPPASQVIVVHSHVLQGTRSSCIETPFVLGPLDQVFHYLTPINVVWVYESACHDVLVPIPRLCIAVRRLLDYYPHLTGRIHRDPDTGVQAVVDIGTGMELLDARCEVTLDSLRGISRHGRDNLAIFDFPDAGTALLPPWPSSHEAPSIIQPLFAIQRTEFSCSAVAIGIRVSHALCGAGGFLNLYQDLAEIYRAIGDDADQVRLANPPSLPPFMAGAMLHMSSVERARALELRPSSFCLASGDEKPESPAATEHKLHLETRADPITGRTLRFSRAALAVLKAQCANSTDGGVSVSTFVALNALLWQRILAARLAQPSCCAHQEELLAKSSFTSNITVAPHLGLPARYFGNSVVSPFLDRDTAEVLAQPLSTTAGMIGAAMQTTASEMLDTVSWISAQPDQSHIRFSFPMRASSLIMSGWHRFPLYGRAQLDVNPAFASPVFRNDGLLDGMAFVFQGRDSNQGLECIMSLRSSTWERLDLDEAFRAVLQDED